jgi:hypothetical protein
MSITTVVVVGMWSRITIAASAIGFLLHNERKRSQIAKIQ